MNKIILLFIILTIEANAQKIFLYNKEIVTNQDLKIITNYTIKLATYKNLDNAQAEKDYLPFESFIITKNRYHGLYSGQYQNIHEAKEELQEIKKIYPDAFIIKTFSLKKQQKEIKKIVLKTPPKKTKKRESYFNLGKKLFSQKKYESALAMYDRELIENPNNKFARLEYARCLYQLKLFESAKVEFQKVLATHPPPNIQKNIHTFLKKMKKSNHKFSGNISTGVSYDDNIYYNTYLETTKYAGLELQNSTEQIKDSYENIDLLLKHQYNNKNFKWDNCFYTYNEFYNQESTNNLNFLNISSIVSKRFNSIYVNLPIGFSYIVIDSKESSNSIYTQPSISFKIAKNTNLTLGTSYIDSTSKIDKERSYTKQGAKLSMINFFDKLSTNGSLQFEKTEKKEGKRFDISKEQLQLAGGVSYSFFKNSLININYYHEKDQYTDMDTALGYKREDNKNRVLFSIKQPLKHGSLSLNYTHTNNDSNINTYSYKKNSYKLGYGYDF